MVGVVVLNWNNARDTIECIESINNSKYKDVKIIIVDNASNDKSVDKILAFLRGEEIDEKFEIPLKNKKYNYKLYDYKYEEIESNSDKDTQIYIIKNNQNGGYAKGNNVGLIFGEKFLNCDYLWVLNNDVEIDESCIGRLVEFSKSECQDNSFIGVTVVEYYKRDTIQFTGGSKYNVILTKSKPLNKGKSLNELEKLEAEFDYIGGCAIFAPTNLFEKVGNFSEDYFLYFEELDLAEKARRYGLKSCWCRNSIIFHKEGNTVGSQSIVQKRSKTSEFYSNISCLTYTRKFHKGAFWIVYYLRFAIKYLRYSILGDKDLRKVLIESYKIYGD